MQKELSEMAFSEKELARYPWQGVPPEYEAVWSTTFAGSRANLNLTQLCPVCGVVALHHWYQAGKSEPLYQKGMLFLGRGALWQWCHACFRYEHFSALVPLWWKNVLEVDEIKLTTLPTAIEDARRKLLNCPSQPEAIRRG